MFDKILIANRGEIACRVIKTARKMGIRTVAVYSDADRNALHVQMADEAVHIGPAPAAQSYIVIDRIMDAIRRTGAQAVHPGYGFLSENAGFAEAVQRQGLCFIGPSPRWIRELGHKTQARAFMAGQGMPQAASSPVLASSDEALAAAWAKASGIAAKFFGSAELYLERLIEAPRHIEFQVLADRHGEVRILFERDCSVQRRHQKVLEEARPVGIPEAQLADMRLLLSGLLARIGYDVIGTVEMLYTPQDGFVFLEMNTRLQVEHAVTEEITGIDIVEAQIRLAAGMHMRQVLPGPMQASGHAIEARIYAEDPVRFLPSPGPLGRFELPTGDGIRVETGYAQGASVTPFYDPMIAKLVAHGHDRRDAIARLQAALAQTRIEGVKTNIPFIQRILAHADFVAGRIDTGIAQRVLSPQP